MGLSRKFSHQSIESGVEPGEHWNGDLAGMSDRIYSRIYNQDQPTMMQVYNK